MKSGGFKSRGGGLKRRAPSSVPEGISRTKLGQIQVRDPDYMKFLHESRTRPLDVAPHIEPSGVLDLHHGKNPAKHSERKRNDATVVPLDHNVHMAIEAGEVEERALQRVFSCWSSFSYWCYKNGRTGTPDDALAFQGWVLEKMEEDQDAQMPPL